ncbi:hypothetical protein [Labrys sp. ZIDIC5]|uniref:hypothetical protein n=1 Tax=Labrys sedimenti TaxID=3106036 RepID=UPI002ACAAE04|nr:hypothetical protein [Labrys sp. ZIDIC5]MDZ5454523.1 hypothetical protein [Labrys sp. ZIDIC5]
MARTLIRLLVIAVVLAAPVATQASESCGVLLKRGGRVIDTYVMDFGSGEKLYVHIVRMPNGQTTKCTTRKPL